jgi:hypothetical protein
VKQESLRADRADSAPDLLELIVAATAPSAPTPRAAEATGAAPERRTDLLVGLCMDDSHPTLCGRVLVRIAAVAGAEETDRWMATLAHLSVRRDDRVLVMQPVNWPEPLVVGVIDGLRPRSAPVRPAASLDLKADETLEVRDQNGGLLLQIVPAPGGPVLRLAHADQRLEVAGRLVIAAEAIGLEAHGEVRVDAGGDVTVTGEEINLN